MSDKDPPCWGEERETSNRLIARITAGDDLTNGQIADWVRNVVFLSPQCRAYIFKEIRAVKEIPRDAIDGLRKLIDDRHRDRRVQLEREWREKKRRSG